MTRRRLLPRGFFFSKTSSVGNHLLRQGLAAIKLSGGSAQSSGSIL
jgi:hypothetical protein